MLRNNLTPGVRQYSAQGLVVHEERVGFLETLATLMGCCDPFADEFPDGRRPDVLRTDPRLTVLFVGDAKNTESPGNVETQARLLGYIRWLAAFVERGAGIGIFALCFGTAGHTPTWVATILMLAREVGLETAEQGVEHFGPGLIVAWFVF